MFGLNKQKNYLTGQCLNPGNYETRSRHADTTEIFKYVRKFDKRKTIRETELKQLILLIENNHISTLKYLSVIFIKLKKQLISADHKWDELAKINNNYKNKNTDYLPIQFSDYFHEQLKTNRLIIADLYNCFKKKFLFYQQNPLSTHFIDPKDPYANFIKTNAAEIDQQTIISSFPEAYSLYQTLKNFVENTYKIQSAPIDAEKLPIKQKFVHQMIKRQRTALLTQPSTFSKPYELNGTEVQFGDQQFYDIASFTEKIKLQVSLLSQNGPFKNNSKKQFRSTPIKCIGCANMLFQGQSIKRDRSSATNFEVIKSVKESKVRLKELIESFMNSPNGGVILFDCDDHLFEVYPKGFQTNTKAYDSKKQSILDIIRNQQFSDFQVDKHFTFDFIIMHDQKGLPIIRSNDLETGITKTQFFVGRLKIFGRRITSELKIGDENQNRFYKNQPHKYLGNEIKIYDTQPIDYQQMKMRFYKNQTILRSIDKPEVFSKIQKAFYNNQHKINELLRGRTSHFFLHQNYPCRQDDVVMITNSIKWTQRTTNEEIIDDQKASRQCLEESRFFVENVQ